MRRDLITDVENATYNTPLTDAMSQYGNLAPSLSIGSSSLSSFDSPRITMSILHSHRHRNPYAISTTTDSLVLRIGSKSRSSRLSISSRSRKILEQGYFDGIPYLSIAFLFTVQFSEQQKFNFSAKRSAKAQEALGNNTFLSCTSYNVDSASYGECDNCAPLSYTNNNLTIVCYEIEQIATTAASTGVLDDDEAAEDDYMNFEQSFTTKQLSAIFQSVGLVIASVLSTNPFSINMEDAKVVISLVGSLAVVLLLGCMYFLKWDEQEDTKFQAFDKKK